MSLIFVVDKDDQVIGYKERGTLTHEEIYRVTALWLTNSKDQVLIAQRKWNKASNPGKWGPAVAGTVEKGETYDASIYKEAKEEIGLDGVAFELGPKRYSDDDVRKLFCQWYTLQLDRDVMDFKIQDEEVEQIKWIDREELIRDLVARPELYTRTGPRAWQEFLK